LCYLLCYILVMSEHDHPARVGVRELRQNLSVYLRRVEQGETFEVTDRGRPVARLGRLPGQEMSVLDRLIAGGRARPAKREFSGFHPVLEPLPGGRSLTDILLAMRDEERY
jgi:antitoxin (DNA-binding transcriptional repressor) of toxin-antitoxin stability system